MSPGQPSVRLAGVTFALGEPIDGSFILLFVFLGTALSVFQEYKSNAAADKLRSYLVRTITIRRDGEEREVPIEEILPHNTRAESTLDLHDDSRLVPLHMMLPPKAGFVPA